VSPGGSGGPIRTPSLASWFGDTAGQSSLFHTWLNLKNPETAFPSLLILAIDHSKHITNSHLELSFNLPA
jgi:hypothetical protein